MKALGGVKCNRHCHFPGIMTVPKTVKFMPSVSVVLCFIISQTHAAIQLKFLGQWELKGWM